LGPAIGAVVMTFVPEYLRIVKEWEPIITGVILLVVILFFPGGILGTLKKPPVLSLNKFHSLFNRLKTAKKRDSSS